VRKKRFNLKIHACPSDNNVESFTFEYQQMEVKDFSQGKYKEYKSLWKYPCTLKMANAYFIIMCRLLTG
jgi:hypothetical protein